jgi:hypothetical protein
MRLSDRRVREMFAQHGYKIERIKTGKHRKIYARRGDRTLRFVLPWSPSDRRAINNIHADLKRGRGRLQE